MQHREYAHAIRREGLALAAAARMAGVNADVPSCPEWKVADLLGHVGRIHRWVTRILVDRATDRGKHWSEEKPPPVDERLDWFEHGVVPLADALVAAGPSVELWTWTDDKTSGFWARRQANETAVHRFDAQLAASATQPIGRDLALDGIDEFFGLIPFWPWADRVRGNGETLHFHCTDGDGEWLVRLGADGVVITAEHAKGDVAARGTASDLLLFLYGRVPAEQLEVFGDASLLVRWRELVSW
jgi:uncharacterized protein (TIGR03083 family)